QRSGMFEIDKDLNIFSRKSIPSKFIFKEHFREWMETLVENFQSLTETYVKYISDDGRLIGIEKNSIKVRLESLLFLIVSLLQSIEGENKIHTLEENRGQDLHLMFLTVSSYEIKGAASSVKISQRKNLSEWMKNQLSPKMKILIQALGASLLDGNISDKEKKTVLDEAYSLLTELVYINIAIEYSAMHQ
ncbi:MAG: hypothetical protein OEZ34_13285, partial [Spirochaetia bacterium]|nr:hypothetical protein [Spirochaetia bacterium]